MWVVVVFNHTAFVLHHGLPILSNRNQTSWGWKVRRTDRCDSKMTPDVHHLLVQYWITKQTLLMSHNTVSIHSLVLCKHCHWHHGDNILIHTRVEHIDYYNTLERPWTSWRVTLYGALKMVRSGNTRHAIWSSQLPTIASICLHDLKMSRELDTTCSVILTDGT